MEEDVEKKKLEFEALLQKRITKRAGDLTVKLKAHKE